MRNTLLGTFATEFDRAARPFLTSLGRGVDALAAEGEALLAREVLLGLRHARQRLDALAHEVAERRGAVLILGPAKAGKSTLINALSGAYVTKVTSLPTYPAVASITHGSDWGVTLEPYDGEVEVLRDAAATRDRLRQCELELPSTMRRVEEAGETFDPRRHALGAIRRIRVQLPVEGLARTGVAFHEVPADGRFGFEWTDFFDEFDSVPTTAIVVLRPGDLFAHPLFAGIEAMLGRCGTIFVVVNLDANARCIDADGALTQEADAAELLEALRRTASGSWKRALDEGRIRLIALDALTAAQLRLGGAEENQSADGAANPLTQLTRDLVTRLDQLPATASFFSESLRSSIALTEKVAGLCQARSIVDLREKLAERKDERTEVMRQKDAMDRLARLELREWDSGGALGRALDAMTAAVRARSAHQSAALSRAIAERLGVWFKSSEGLQVLVRKTIGPLFVVVQKEMAGIAQAELVRLSDQEQLAADLPVGIRNDLDFARVRFAELARTAAEGLDVVPALRPIPLPLKMDDIPIKKSWSDRLLARRMPTVRKRALEPPDLSDEWKASRLAEGAQAELQDLLDRRVVRFVAERGEQICGASMEAFLAALTQGLGVKLERRRERFDPQVDQVEAAVVELERVRSQFAELERASKIVHESLADLAGQYTVAEEEERPTTDARSDSPAPGPFSTGQSSDAG